jgi:hypothetical protein
MFNGHVINVIQENTIKFYNLIKDIMIKEKEVVASKTTKEKQTKDLFVELTLD